MGFEWILLDYIGRTYMSTNISKYFHPFSTFPRPVDPHFGLEMDHNRPKIDDFGTNVRPKVNDWDLNGL